MAALTGRGQSQLIQAAVDHARAHGASVVEVYPVDDEFVVLRPGETFRLDHFYHG